MVMPARTQNGHESDRAATQRTNACARRQDTPIDWAHLSRFTMNDRALEQEVLGLFAIEAPRYLAQLNAAADRKDWIEAAHTLKGSARAVGAWAIASSSLLALLASSAVSRAVWASVMNCCSSRFRCRMPSSAA
jgi:HPt (histidine-containing phosphotransfer) domain-containing protein